MFLAIGRIRRRFKETMQTSSRTVRSTWSKACIAYHTKQITFDQFYKYTHSKIRCVANASFKRMKLPACVGLEDVEQQYYMHAFRAFAQYNAQSANAQRLERYIFVYAHLETRQWLHKQRGAQRKDVRSPSRLHDTIDSAEQDYPACPLDSEKRLQARAALKLLLKTLPKEDAQILVALVANAGDAVATAKAISPQYAPLIRRRVAQVIKHSKRLLEAHAG